jgi:hypothetical protein
MAKEKNELATTGTTAVAVVDQSYLEEMAVDSQGASGFENVKPEDMSIPFVKVLQALAPQLRGTTKIPGAEEGNFYNTVTGEVYKDKIVIVPCAYQKAFVEWVTREQGGGFVGQYFDSSILSNTKKDDKNRDILANGNSIVTTAYHYCLLVKPNGDFERVVMSLTSTQLKKSRRWLAQMSSLQIVVGTKRITPPMYSHTYDVTSVEETNDHGTWYGYNFGTPSIIALRDLYVTAKKFHDDITAGTVKTAEPPEHDDVSNSAPTSTSNVAEKF